MVVTSPASATALGFAAGHEIVREGELGDTMFVILEGRAAVSTASGGLVTVLDPGHFFGEMAVIDAQPRSATVTAMEDGTRVLPIDQARFVYLVSQQPAFALDILAALSQRVRGQPAAVMLETKVSSDYAAHEIRRRLWQLRARGRACNCYLIRGRDRTVLVDTGLPSSAPALVQALEQAGCSPDDLDLVVLTHEHTDHAGGAAHLSGRPLIAAHPAAAGKLGLGDDLATASSVIGDDLPPLDVGLHLSDGSVIECAPYRLEVVHTPGHTSGCLSLLEPALGSLLCGDTVMAGGAMGGIFGSGNISDYIRSLERLQRLEPSVLLPRHGRASDDGTADIGAALVRARALLADTRELYRAFNGRWAFDRILQSVRGLNR